MRLFLYGTLLDPVTLATRSGDPGLPARCQSAMLRGWRRVNLGRTKWPTLRREPKSTVAGKVVVAGAAAMRRLTAWEEPPYRLRPVVLQPRMPAWTWIAPRGTNQPWMKPTKEKRHDQL